MKKIILSLTAVMLLTGSAYAGSIGVGVSGSLAQIEAAGTETTGAGTVSGGAANTNSKDVNEIAIIGSIFLDYEFDNGIVLGLSHVPGSADVSDKTHSRTETAQGVSGTDASGSVTRTAAAEIENFNTIYVEYPMGNVYAKLGWSQLDVNTLETAITDSGTYGNATLDGYTVGLGINGEINLLWNAYAGFQPTDYLIFRSINNGSMNQIGTLPGTNLTYTDLTPPAGILNYQVRAINFFNSDIEKKIKNENIDELILIYESKTKEIIKKYTVSKEETYFLLKTIFESDTLKKALKNEESEKLWNQQELLKLYDFFGAKYNNKFLKEYNFEASTVSEQEKNYEIYSEFYKELLDYNFEKNTFSIFSKKFKSIFNRSFSNYYVLLDDYVDIKNTKNTLILLSILFQIIGLVALAILFRNLVLENK